MFLKPRLSHRSQSLFMLFNLINNKNTKMKITNFHKKVKKHIFEEKSQDQNVADARAAG